MLTGRIDVYIYHDDGNQKGYLPDISVSPVALGDGQTITRENLVEMGFPNIPGADILKIEGSSFRIYRVDGLEERRNFTVSTDQFSTWGCDFSLRKSGTLMISERSSPMTGDKAWRVTFCQQGYNLHQSY